jgi:hypothetical protein
MFCPKCGKDCGSAKVCVMCGQVLKSQTTPQSFSNIEQILQASGQVYCPRCLSTNVTACDNGIRPSEYLLIRGMFSMAVLVSALFRKIRPNDIGQNYSCNDCGNQWNADRTVLHKKHEEILTRYLGAYSTIAIPAPEGACLQLGQRGLRFYRSEADAKVIPYDEITAVGYQKGIGPLYGWLVVRDRANKQLLFPKTFVDAKKDKLTIFCHSHYENGYYQIFCALNEIAEENKKAGLF